jgi:hypothetical protein
MAIFAKPLPCGLTLIVSGAGMGSITRLLFAVVSVMSVLLGTSCSADASKQKKNTSAKPESAGKKACPCCRQISGGNKTNILKAKLEIG